VGVNGASDAERWRGGRRATSLPNATKTTQSPAPRIRMTTPPGNGTLTVSDFDMRSLVRGSQVRQPTPQRGTCPGFGRGLISKLISYIEVGAVGLVTVAAAIHVDTSRYAMGMAPSWRMRRSRRASTRSSGNASSAAR